MKQNVLQATVVKRKIFFTKQNVLQATVVKQNVLQARFLTES